MSIFSIKSLTPEEKKNRMQVRALLAIAFAGAIIAGFFLKLVEPQAFITIASVAISWYFAKKDAEDDQKENDSKPKPPEA